VPKANCDAATRVRLEARARVGGLIAEAGKLGNNSAAQRLNVRAIAVWAGLPSAPRHCSRNTATGL
jgi:hypothetical protein